MTKKENFSEQPQIAQLLRTLDENGLTKELTEVQSLVSYIDNMEGILTGMLGELQDMRREINLIHNGRLRSKCENLVQKTDDKIQEGFSAVRQTKDNLIKSAENAVKAFREKGREALVQAIRAMKIPEVLDKLASLFGRLSRDIAQDMVKLEAMNAELQSAKGHLRNMGLLLSGKASEETEHIKTDKGILSRLCRLFGKTQKGFAALEQKAMDAADKLRVNRVKTTVKETLNRYEETVKNEIQADTAQEKPEFAINENGVLVKYKGNGGDVVIPDSVTSIGNSAFWNCKGLESVTIPNSVKYISDYAFDGCTGLTSITVDENNPNYSSVDGVLYNKDKTEIILAPQKCLEKMPTNAAAQTADSPVNDLDNDNDIEDDYDFEM